MLVCTTVKVDEQPYTVVPLYFVVPKFDVVCSQLGLRRRCCCIWKGLAMT
jgi:hypothetical protein